MDTLKEETSDTMENCIKIEVPYDLYKHIKANGKLENLCRTCLSPTESSVSLLSVAEEGSETCLLDVLQAFTAIHIILGSGLPTQICTTCEAELLHCYNYKVKCEQSECTLQSLVKGQFIPTADNIAEVRELLNKIDENTSELDDGNNYVKKEDIKEELEIHYLDDFDYGERDDEALYIVQEQSKKKNNVKKIGSTKSRARHKETELKSKTEKRKYVKNNVESPNQNNPYKKPKTVRAYKTSYSSKHQNSDKTSYQCRQCKEAFTCEKDLQLHLSLHDVEGPLWKCNMCAKEFKTRPMLRRHIHRHMETKRFKCPVCNKAFSEMYSMRRHSRVHTGEIVEKKHVCNICGKRYVANNLLKAHMSTHTSVRPFVCAVCGKTFASSRLLNSHRLVHTDDKPFACEYCDKRFRHDSTRNTHHRTHTGEKPYVCSACGKSFIQNSNLRLHMRTHTGEKPYQCSKCDKKFSSGSSLKIHIRTHTGEKPYSCKLCNKKFARQDIGYHMRSHTGERPHACNFCPKKFASATTLREHCRIHTGEKPFECATCTQTFPSKSRLIKHFKKHQPNGKRKRQYFILPPVEPLRCSVVISSNEKVKPVIDSSNKNENLQNDGIKNAMEMVHDMPLEVTGELIVQDEGEVLVVDNSENQNSSIYLSTEDSATFTQQCREFDNNVNLVAVNEGGIKILDKSLLEGSTVKPRYK